MDLVAGVRKEGSRGGRAEFKWDDVKDSQHRENYLGHSLMAPVGRWQKNKDLSWYAKGDNSSAALSAAEARREEIQKIKQAEQDAMSEALGFGPAPKRSLDANETPLGKKDVERAIRETKGEADEITREDTKGIGFGAFEGLGEGDVFGKDEVLLGEGIAGGMAEERALRRILEEEKPHKHQKRQRSRSRSRDREKERNGSRERRHRRHEEGESKARRRHHRRYRSRERSGNTDQERQENRHRGHREHYRKRSYERRQSPRRHRSRSREKERDYDRRR